MDGADAWKNPADGSSEAPADDAEERADIADDTIDDEFASGAVAVDVAGLVAATGITSSSSSSSRAAAAEGGLGAEAAADDDKEAAEEAEDAEGRDDAAPPPRAGPDENVP